MPRHEPWWKRSQGKMKETWTVHTCVRLAVGLVHGREEVLSQKETQQVGKMAQVLRGTLERKLVNGRAGCYLVRRTHGTSKKHGPARQNACGGWAMETRGVEPRRAMCRRTIPSSRREKLRCGADALQHVLQNQGPTRCTRR